MILKKRKEKRIVVFAIFHYNTAATPLTTGNTSPRYHYGAVTPKR